MKKITFMLAAAAVLSLASCGNKDKENNDSINAVATEEVTEASTDDTELGASDMENADESSLADETEGVAETPDMSDAKDAYNKTMKDAQNAYNKAVDDLENDPDYKASKKAMNSQIKAVESASKAMESGDPRDAAKALKDYGEALYDTHQALDD